MLWLALWPRAHSEVAARVHVGVRVGCARSPLPPPPPRPLPHQVTLPRGLLLPLWVSEKNKKQTPPGFLAP